MFLRKVVLQFGISLVHVLMNCAAIGVCRSCSAFGLFVLVLSVTTPEPPRMMSSSANYRPFLSSFCHISPQESFAKLAN